jgi:hypothetical protein
VRSLPTLLLLLSAGCTGVSETGPYGIKGRLVQGDGQPITGQRIENLEHGTRTGPEGGFTVKWRAPETYVTFQRGGLTWRRVWLPEQDAGEVTVALPATARGELVCRTDLQCRAEALWELGDGLTARKDVVCGQETPVVAIEAMPPGLPQVSCSTVMGEMELEVSRNHSRVEVVSRPPPRPLAFSGAREPSDCTAHILDGEVVEGIGQVGLQPARPTYAWATCGGRPGPPVSVSPRPVGLTDVDARVTLTVAEEGASLTLDPPVPEPDELTLIHLTDEGGVDWEMRLPAVSGRYALPPLPRGRYLVSLGARSLLASKNPPDPEIPGTAVLLYTPGVWGEEAGYVGAIRLEEPHVGPLEVDGHPPPGQVPWVEAARAAADTDSPDRP